MKEEEEEERETEKTIGKVSET
jgi:hypothetical protein